MILAAVIFIGAVVGVDCGILGSRITSRDHEEVDPGRTIVIPGIEKRFEEDGKVTAFEYYNNKEGRIRFQVWRYKAFHQDEETHSLELVTETDVIDTPSAVGVTIYDIFKSPLLVKAGDVIGLEYMYKNPIPYDHNGAECQDEKLALHLDLENRTIISLTELMHFKEITPVRNPCRTYSFRAQVIYESEECQGVPVEIGADGVLKSPGFNGRTNYQDNIETCWLLSAPNKHAVKLNIKFFQLEKPGRGRTCYDYLRLVDGEYPTNDNEIAKLCGSNPTTTTYYGMSSRHMYVEFKTDVANRNKGFNLTYSAVASSDVPSGANKPPLSATRPPDDKYGGHNDTEREQGGDGDGNNTGMIVGIVIAVIVVVAVVVVVFVVVWKKKSDGTKMRASQSRVSDSGQANLVNNEVKEPHRAPPTPEPPREENMQPPPRLVQPAPLDPSAPVAPPQYQETLKTVPPSPQAVPLPRSVTPVGPPSSHLPPLQHNPVLRPFTAANPRRKGPVDHDPVPVDIDPETSREMGTPLPQYQPDETDEKAASHVSYPNPAFDANDQDDNRQAQSHPISPPPPYSVHVTYK